MFENLKKSNTGRIRVKVVASMLAMILTFANFTFLGSYIGKTSYAIDSELYKQDDGTNSDNVDLDASQKEETIEEEASLDKVADQVEIKVSPKAMTKTLYQGQIVTYEIAVKNNTAEDLRDPKIVYTVPEGAVLTELTYSQGTEITYTDKEKIEHRTITFDGILGAGETRTAEITLRINKDAVQIVNNIVAQNTEGEVIGTLVTEPVEVIPGDLTVMLSRADNYVTVLSEKSDIIGIVMITNNTNSAMKNLQIKSKLPEETIWLEDAKYNKDWSYDKQTKEISYKLDSLVAGETSYIRFKIEVDKINDETYEDIIDNMVLVKTESGIEYASNVYENKANKAYWKINMESKHSETLKEGDSVKYVLNVTNIGKESGLFTLLDEIPQEIDAQKIIYYYEDEKDEKTTEVLNNNTIKVMKYIDIGKTFVIEIEGKVKDLNDNYTSKKITNIAKISLEDNKYIESNVITNTIVKNSNGSQNNPSSTNNPNNSSSTDNPNSTSRPDGTNSPNSTDNSSRPDNPNNSSGIDNSNNPSSSNNSNNPSSTDDPNNSDEPEDSENQEGLYSISGMVWLDQDKDGIRGNGEEEIGLQRILLLDENEKVIKETKSSLTGTYKFTNLEKGKYSVAIVYDEEKYAITKYQVVAAEESENSDVVTKQITIDSENIQVGITDTITISNKNITNIDMGLIENPVFDLSLNKYITKVVVTTKEEAKTYEYEEPTSLAKVEISKKEISGASLLVEYEIEVVNEGDVEGYVTDIIDYLPKELTFSSEMNPEWYIGADGDLHYMALEPEAIAPGKSQKVKLVLTKNLKNNSTGTITNVAEIGENTNLNGIAEIDSIAGNNKEDEDDISKAELIVSIKTGEPVLYIGIVIASMLVLGIGIYIINKKVLKVRF